MSAQQPAIRELQANDDVLRAILSSRALSALPEAFFLRANERDSGLSVSFDCTTAECRSIFDTTYGVASLNVGRITELNLTVVPDQPKHANIKGIPYKEDDPDTAEWLASQLAERATIIDKGKVKRS
jgi:hypothetical protein